MNIGRTPVKLVEAGIPFNDLSIGASIIRKAQNEKNPDHKLSPETISEVLKALYNPIAVIKAEQNKNEKRLITDILLFLICKMMQVIMFLLLLKPTRKAEELY